MRIGVHVSIAGKIYEAIEKARSLKCNTMQIFSRNPRAWGAKDISKEDLEIFKRERNRYDIRPVVVHIPYLVNLASPERALYHKSVNAFIEDVRIADLLNAEYFVTHLGSHRGRGKDFGLKRFSDGLIKVLKKVRPTAQILLETTAGSGYCIGERFEDLKFIIDRVGSRADIGVCMDTAHVFAAGYDISKSAGLKSTLKEFDKVIGLKRLKVIHLNDSKAALGARVDRHEHIGMGWIGREGFRRILNEPRLSKVPFILETPGDEELKDVNNLETVRRLCRKTG
ncbi:MAG: deoxyribonuclease IV [Candidatus Omnitrophota bacterium]